MPDFQTETLAIRNIQHMLHILYLDEESEPHPYLENLRYVTKTGVFAAFVVTLHIPVQKVGGDIVYVRIEYLFEVRVKTGRNYAYGLKIYLNALDVFGGAADFAPNLGIAIFNFEDRVRCAADRLQKRDTIASFKL